MAGEGIPSGQSAQALWAPLSLSGRRRDVHTGDGGGDGADSVGGVRDRGGEGTMGALIVVSAVILGFWALCFVLGMLMETRRLRKAGFR
jgi:hypothetical protein